MQPMLWRLLLLCSWCFLLLEVVTLCVRGWKEALAFRLILLSLTASCYGMRVLTQNKETHQRLDECVRWLLCQDVIVFTLVLVFSPVIGTRVYSGVVVALIVGALVLPYAMHASERWWIERSTHRHVIV
jgi:hypothetical protein